MIKEDVKLIIEQLKETNNISDDFIKKSKRRKILEELSDEELNSYNLFNFIKTQESPYINSSMNLCKRISNADLVKSLWSSYHCWAQVKRTNENVLSNKNYVMYLLKEYNNTHYTLEHEAVKQIVKYNKDNNKIIMELASLPDMEPLWLLYALDIKFDDKDYLENIYNFASVNINFLNQLNSKDTEYFLTCEIIDFSDMTEMNDKIFINTPCGHFEFNKEDMYYYIDNPNNTTNKHFSSKGYNIMFDALINELNERNICNVTNFEDLFQFVKNNKEVDYENSR